jgi:hypothetical protein
MSEQEDYSVTNIIGEDDVDDFLNFNLTSIQGVISKLSLDQAVDEANALMLQQYALLAADKILEFIAKTTKTAHNLEHQANQAYNLAALNFKPSDGSKPTMEMRKMAGEADPAVYTIQMRIGKAKGLKAALDRKYDVLIKAHHHFKDIVNSHRKMNNTNPLSSQSIGNKSEGVPGWG